MTRFTLALLWLLAAAFPSAAAPRVWIDTDPACGLGAMSDPDDCFALLHLLTSPKIDVVGLSTIFGNTSVDDTTAVARDLLNQMHATVPLYKGAREESDGRHARTTPASTAITHALEQGPLTFIALGPLTNLATVLQQRPDLASRVSSTIAVMGKMPGEIFHPAEGSPTALLRHGPIFQDLNFAKDPRAAATVLAAGIPLTLTPYAIGKTQSITQKDLNRLTSQGGAAAWLAQRSQAWLGFWRDVIGRDGFYPFDLVAAVIATDPGKANCATAHVVIAPDTKVGWFGGGPTSLLFAPAGEGTHRVTTCKTLSINAIDLLHKTTGTAR